LLRSSKREAISQPRRESASQATNGNKQPTTMTPCSSRFYQKVHLSFSLVSQLYLQCPTYLALSPRSRAHSNANPSCENSTQTVSKVRSNVVDPLRWPPKVHVSSVELHQMPQTTNILSLMLCSKRVYNKRVTKRILFQGSNHTLWLAKSRTSQSSSKNPSSSKSPEFSPGRETPLRLLVVITICSISSVLSVTLKTRSIADVGSAR
jgi:hypothetical protein